ncbi:acyl carrier protein, partial [Kibdelosporangium lantanae]
MMDRAELVAAIETALGEVLEREVTGLTEDPRLFEDVHLDSVDPETLDMDDFRSVGTLADYLDAQQTDSALA